MTVLANLFNWLALPRAFFVIRNPLRFFAAFALRRSLSEVVVRTPIGDVRIWLRNYESIKTLFSVFCRYDYATPEEPAICLMDVGANIGITSLYFLSRNRANHAVCFEPDSANVDILRRNLHAFADRSEIHVCALATSPGTATFFRAEDGKYSSLIRSERACLPDHIECRVFGEALSAIETRANVPVVVKLDVEGLELDLVRSLAWEGFPAVYRLVCEGTVCGRAISRPHARRVRSGYVEDMTFPDYARRSRP
jgi:FkbM family methyltransferase